MLLAALLLTATVPAQAGPGGNFNTAYEQAFRTSFRASSIEQCVASAQKASAANVDFTPICACAADRILAQKSLAELQKPLPAEEARPILMECAKSHPPAGTAVRR